MVKANSAPCTRPVRALGLGPNRTLAKSPRPAPVHDPAKSPKPALVLSLELTKAQIKSLVGPVHDPAKFARTRPVLTIHCRQCVKLSQCPNVNLRT